MRSNELSISVKINILLDTTYQNIGFLVPIPSAWLFEAISMS